MYIRLICLFHALLLSSFAAAGIQFTKDGAQLNRSLYFELHPNTSTSQAQYKISNPSTRIRTHIVNIDGKYAVPIHSLFLLGGLRFDGLSNVLTPGVRYQIYINKAPKQDHFEMLYNPDDSSKSNVARWKSLAGLPLQTWTNWDFHLPNMSGNYHHIQSIPFDINLRLYGPLDSSKGRLAREETLEIYVHSVSRIESNETLGQSFQRPEKNWDSLYFLIISSLVVTLYFATRKIIVLFVCLMAIPPLLSLLFLVQWKSKLGENLESILLKQSQIRLKKTFLGMSSIADRLEHRLQKDIHDTLTKFRVELKTQRKAGLNLNQNEFDDYFQTLNETQQKQQQFYSSKNSTNPIDRFLYKIYQDSGFIFTFTNGKAIYTPLRHPSERKKGTVAKLFRQIAMKNVVTRGGEEYWRAIGQNRENLLALRDIFRQAMGSSEVLDDFLNNPGRLVNFEIRKKELGTSNFQFWDYFFHNETAWLCIGSVSNSLYLNYMWREVSDYLADTGFTGEFYIDGMGRIPSFPKSFQNLDSYSHVASLVRATNQHSFQVDTENSHFYFGSKLNADSNLVVVLREDTKPFEEQLRAQRLSEILGWTGLFLVLILTALLIGLNTSRRFLTLKKGFAGLRAGNFESRVAIDGKDQLSDLAAQFNRVLIQFKEKEILARFLSKKAISQLDSEVHSSKEEVTILFCTVQKLPDKRSGHNFRSLSNDLLFEIQSSLDEYGGYLDKFMGNSALCVFTQRDRDSIEVCSRVIHKQLTGLTNLIPGLQIGVGIASGEAIVGVLGQEGRRDFSVIGSPVNLASRLSYLLSDSPVSFFMDELSLNKLKIEKERILSEQFLEIKGFDQKQRVYEIL